MTPDQHKATMLIRYAARCPADDLMGIGEQLEDELSDLDPEEAGKACERIADLIRTATITVTWDDDPPAKPQLIGVPDDGYYLNGDDGYLWLTCNRCDDPLMEAQAGDNLADFNAKAAAHQATCAATQPVQEAQQ